MSLRDEIIESQKSRSDFFKWKLILVAALGATGLGLKENASPASGSILFEHIDYILLLIPYVCIYVDLVCKHETLRMLVIGHYLKGKPSDNEKDYEEFVSAARQLIVDADSNKTMSAYDLEDWALHSSTYIVSILIIIYGFIDCVHNSSLKHLSLFIVAGLGGLVVACWVNCQYQRRIKALQSESK